MENTNYKSKRNFNSNYNSNNNISSSNSQTSEVINPNECPWSDIKKFISKTYIKNQEINAKATTSKKEVDSITLEQDRRIPSIDNSRYRYIFATRTLPNEGNETGEPTDPTLFKNFYCMRSENQVLQLKQKQRFNNDQNDEKLSCSSVPSSQSEIWAKKTVAKLIFEEDADKKGQGDVSKWKTFLQKKRGNSQKDSELNGDDISKEEQSENSGGWSRCCFCDWCYPKGITLKEKQEHTNCCIDGNGSKNKSELWETLKTVRRNAQQLNTCYVCGKVISNKKILNAHIKKCAYKKEKSNVFV